MRATKTLWTKRQNVRRLAAGLLCLLTVACGSGGSGRAPVDPAPVPVQPQPGMLGDGRLEEILDYVVADTGVPAAAAVFLHRGTIAEQAAAGVRAQGRPGAVTGRDRWHVGSITKSMTATLTAVLVENGALDWDTTIGDVFPELAGTVHAAHLDTRLDELLSHTGGVSTRSSAIANAVAREGGSVRSQRRRFTERVLAVAPEQARGSYAYSNAGYIVAGAMLEKTTGMDWESLMTQFVFAPLGMLEAGFGAPGWADSSEQPAGHVPDGAGWRPLAADSPEADNPPVFGPAGTVHATLDDIAKYLAAHLSGARGVGVPGFLDADGFAKLHEPRSAAGYALGWNVSDISLHHVGSNNRWYAQIVAVPELDIAIFAVTNAADTEAPDHGQPNRALVDIQRFFQARFEAAFPAD